MHKSAFFTPVIRVQDLSIISYEIAGWHQTILQQGVSYTLFSALQFYKSEYYIDCAQMIARPQGEYNDFFFFFYSTVYDNMEFYSLDTWTLLIRPVQLKYIRYHCWDYKVQSLTLMEKHYSIHETVWFRK